jgi:hypothetical protein
MSPSERGKEIHSERGQGVMSPFLKDPTTYP